MAKLCVPVNLLGKVGKRCQKIINVTELLFLLVALIFKVNEQPTVLKYSKIMMKSRPAN